jgi:hypothetical protein
MTRDSHIGKLHNSITKASLALATLWMLAVIFGSIERTSRCNAQTRERISFRSGSGRSTNEAQLVARRKYIVEDLAVCEQCHPPHTSTGAFDRPHYLLGAC